MAPETIGTDKVRENRLRRTAERRGFVFSKTRRRDPRAVDYGHYYLADASTNGLMFDAANLDELEQFLEGYTQDLPAARSESSGAGQDGSTESGGQNRKYRSLRLPDLQLRVQYGS